ncbi:MAG: carbamoyltransferase [Bradymonadia bacterium]|jgi:carbamoyltransferase
MSARTILGVSALYHDSAAAVIRDGEIIAAAQEERFTRVKGDARIPHHAITYVLDEAGIKPGQLDRVVFMDKPLTKFTRLLTTYAGVAPRGLQSFMMAMPAWLKEKGWAQYHIEKFLRRLGHRGVDVQMIEHHQAHAASAFYPSPFEEAAIITCDGVGEWATTTVGVGEGNRMRLLFEQRFPHSIGMLYSAFTYYCGFKVNSGEYKLMGLAPYGEPVYADLIKAHFIDLREDGSFRLNMKYFGYLSGLTMTNDAFDKVLGGPRRSPETEITPREMDIARSIQAVTEDIMLNMARYARAVTGKKNLCLAGGVALNCVANGKILRANIFDEVFIQPAAGDAGGSLGAALYSWYQTDKNPRVADGKNDVQKGSLLGPGFTNDEIQVFLDANDIPYERFEPEARDDKIADVVANKGVVGLFQGRMEYGPRALCNRSILADARSTEMQSFLNLATKFRESFRPFAPVCLAEEAPKFFEEIHDSPYMLLVDQVKADRLVANDGKQRGAEPGGPGGVPRSKRIYDWVNTARSDVPAITHVDNSARIQTIDKGRNPRMHRILERFKDKTGIGLMVNTSFNVRSEPIVCTPEHAYVCFMRTGITHLVLEDFILSKDAQPDWDDDDWRSQFAAD